MTSPGLQPPAHASAALCAVYADVVPHLGRVTQADAVAVESLCVAIMRAREADRLLDAEGTYLQHPNGHVYAHPALRVSQRAHLDVARMSAKFGLTPADRQRIEQGTPKPRTFAEDMAARGIPASPRTVDAG